MVQFFKTESPFTTSFGKSPRMNSPSLKQKKATTFLKISFENQNDPTPLLSLGEYNLTVHPKPLAAFNKLN